MQVSACVYMCVRHYWVTDTKLFLDASRYLEVHIIMQFLSTVLN